MQTEIEFLDGLVGGIAKLQQSIDDTKDLHSKRGLDVGIWIVLGLFVETLGEQVDDRLCTLRTPPAGSFDNAMARAQNQWAELQAKRDHEAAETRQAEKQKTITQIIAEAQAAATARKEAEARKAAQSARQRFYDSLETFRAGGALPSFETLQELLQRRQKELARVNA